MVSHWGAGCFPAIDYVHVMPAAQAVVHDGEEAVGIGGEIDADDLGFFIDDMVDEAGVLMGEAVVVLPPDVGGEEIIQRGDFSAPGEAGRDFEPFGVLVEHRIDDVDEGFVAIEEPVAAGEEIAFEPAFALVFAEDFHDAAVGGEEFVDGDRLCFPLAVGGFENGVEVIGESFVGAEDAEVAVVLI